MFRKKQFFTICFNWQRRWTTCTGHITTLIIPYSLLVSNGKFRHGIFHRDIKPENILIVDNLLKLADFGSCRGIYSKQPYTEYISTRWYALTLVRCVSWVLIGCFCRYRAPECLLTDGYYGYKMDLWGVGSVMFEISE